MRGECKAHPAPPTHCFSAESCKNIRAAPIGRRPRWESRQPASIGRQAAAVDPLLLVDRRREPAARFHFGDRRIIDGSERISYPVSRACIRKILKFWFLLLDNEPISVSHFSSFLHILSQNNIMAEFQWLVRKHKLFYSKCLWISYFFFPQIFNFIGSSVIYLFLGEIPIRTHQQQFGLKIIDGFGIFLLGIQW